MSERNGNLVRRLGADDLAAMRDLLRCFGEAFDEVTTYTQYQPDDEYLRRLLCKSTFFVLVAEHKGVVVGGLAAYELEKFEQARSEIYIYDLAVNERYRRQSVATSLIKELQRIAKIVGAYEVFVQADYIDEPAVALYSKLGVREEVLHFGMPV